VGLWRHCCCCRRCVWSMPSRKFKKPCFHNRNEDNQVLVLFLCEIDFIVGCYEKLWRTRMASPSINLKPNLLLFLFLF
jgi:hypothetical protein